ncbi:MAG: small multidrug resistance protein [Prochlorothrix sp.]|nr:small multidrug resistance protein [Prochlorothrix sp.]
MFQVALTTVLILFSATLNTSAQVLLKTGSGQDSPINLWVASGLALYALSAVVYIGLLGRLNLSMVYPIIIGLTTIATIVAGMLVFQEKVSFTSWIGVGLVIAGISAITLGRTVQG